MLSSAMLMSKLEDNGFRDSSRKSLGPGAVKKGASTERVEPTSNQFKLHAATSGF